MVIEVLVSKLTLDEKISMLHGTGLFHNGGVERLGIPELVMSDGPMGVRNDFEDAHWMVIGNSDDYVSYLPSNSALASTWNRKLAYETGTVLGEEARGHGKDVILAPGINIKRSPLCGRNFEYMSEDPYLTGEMAVPLVKEGQVYSLMGAYNRYNGEHCCESKTLLNHILCEEWKFDGMVVSDWGGVHLTREAATSGLDLEMSVTDNFDEYCMAQPLKKAVEDGEIQEALIDEKVKNILRLMYRLHMLGEDVAIRKPGSYNTPEHRQKTLDVARESIVLLKNDKNQLPLCQGKTRKVLVVGDNANRIQSYGGGSAEIKALYEITPLLGIKMLLGGNAKVDYVPGYYADNFDHMNTETNWQADSLENGGGSMGENGGVAPDIIVVMFSGSPVEMPWIKRVHTLIWNWFNGMEGGTALAEILFGKVNPSGCIYLL